MSDQLGTAPAPPRARLDSSVLRIMGKARAFVVR